jgi:predicted dehydrogenase
LKYQIKRYLKAEELINACDAVDIVAPTIYHYELCEMALKKGKHVFVEKPLANSMDEAKELVKLAKESRKKVLEHEKFKQIFS